MVQYTWNKMKNIVEICFFKEKNKNNFLAIYNLNKL